MKTFGCVVAQYRERLKIDDVAIAELVEILGRKVAVDAATDAVAFGADPDRLRYLDPAVLHYGDVAVEFEDALVGAGQQRQREQQQAGKPSHSTEPSLTSGTLATSSDRLLEELTRLETEQAGDDVARYRLGHRVVVAHGTVVIAARELQVILGFHQFGLQFQEILVGLEVRVALRQRQQPVHTFAQGLLHLAARVNVDDAHCLGAQLRDRFERGLFVLRVRVDRLDQLRNQVVAPLQLHVDVAPRGTDPVAAAHQPVVKHHDDGSERGKHDDQESQRHDRIVSPAWARFGMFVGAAAGARLPARAMPVVSRFEKRSYRQH